MSIQDTFQDFLGKITGQANRLDAAIAKLETDHKAALEAKDKEISDIRIEMDKAPKPEAIAEKENEIKALAERAEKAEKAASPEAINAEVARIVASQGHALVGTVSAKEQGKTMTLAEFKTLPHAEREKFIKTGGKLS